MSSVQLCYDCAFKHISDAATIWNEIENGYNVPNHFMKFVGAMSQAADHLLEKHPDVAAEIRLARKEWFDQKVLGLVYRPDFESWAETVWEQIIIGANVAPAEEQKDGKEGSPGK